MKEWLKESLLIGIFVSLICISFIIGILFILDNLNIGESNNTFENILLNNANDRNYLVDVYDCTEFAKEGARRLRNLGYSSAEDIYVSVDLSCDMWNNTNFSGHRIIRIGNSSKVNNNLYIEATSGRVILPEEYACYGLI